MTDDNLDALYQKILDDVLEDDVRLPSLPDITLKVRQAISAETTTCATLTDIIMKDPGLTAYLVQAASSPVYRRAVPPKALSEVIGLLGFSATNSLVMLHSARSMVELKDAASKMLFKHTWERLVVKTSLGSFFAQKFRGMPVDQVQLAMLLTEIGSLTVLSSMLSASESIDTQVYFKMCREYSKKIGCAVLTKWEVDQDIIDMLRLAGQWDATSEGGLGLIDIANLSLYYTVLLTIDKPTLPPIETIAAYEKIPEQFQECSTANWLDLIRENTEEIKAIIASFK